METKAKKKISKDNVLIFFLKNRALLLVLIFFILLSVATDTFLTSSNMVSLARQIAANGIIGVGYTFLLASDSVDLSAGYMMCMIGIISGLLSQTGMPFICILIWKYSNNNKQADNKQDNIQQDDFLICLCWHSFYKIGTTNRCTVVMADNRSPDC